MALSMSMAFFLVAACTGKKEENSVSSLGGNDDVVVIDIDKAKEKKMHPGSRNLLFLNL